MCTGKVLQGVCSTIYGPQVVLYSVYTRTSMSKVPVMLLDIADLRSTKDPQVVIGTKECPCTWTALQSS